MDTGLEDRSQTRFHDFRGSPMPLSIMPQSTKLAIAPWITLHRDCYYTSGSWLDVDPIPVREALMRSLAESWPSDRPFGLLSGDQS